MAASTIAAAVLGWPLTPPSADRIVAVFARHIATERDRELTSFAIFEDWRARATSLDRLAGYTLSTVNLVGEPAPLTIRAAEITPDFFDTLDAHPALGRGFLSQASASAGAVECVISDALWRSRFGARQSVIGSIVHLDVVNGRGRSGPFTIVGVAPPALRYPERVDVWMQFMPQEFWLTNRSGQWFGVVGRLRPDVSVQQATTEMNTVMSMVQTEQPGPQPTHTANLVPIHELLTARYHGLVIGLAATAGVLLLVVSASAGGLLAARALGEQRHDSIRLSLGAQPIGLIAAAGREGLVLGVVAFAVSVPAALACLRILGSFSAELFDLPLPSRIGWTSALSGAGCAIAMSSALAVLAKAHTLRARPVGVWPGRTSVGHGRATTKLRSLLIVGEIALSVLLLAAAGDLLSRVATLRKVDLGFETDRLLTVRVALPPSRYAGAGASQFYEALIERVRALPSVAGVAASSDDPLFGVSNNPEFTLQYEHRTLTPDQRTPVLVNGVTDAYFDVLGLRVLEGELPSATAAGSGVLPAAINQAFARRLYADERPIGRRFRFGGNNAAWWTIVGIVADARNDGPVAAARPTAYLRYPAFGKSAMTLLVKARNDVDLLVPDIRAIVTTLDPNVPIGRIAAATDLVEARFASLRIGALVMSVLAIAALILSALGLYGVLAAASTEIRPEIGLRMALGASPRDVTQLVLRRAGSVVGAGLLLGAACTVIVGLTLKTVLPIHVPTPMEVIALIATVAGAALLAAARPAWQALRVSPVDALRAE